MKQRHKTFFNWSTGKDAALALYHLQQDENFDVGTLLTSVNTHHERISMHGVRRALLEEQAESIGIPLVTIDLPEEPGMDEYESIMRETLEQLCAEGYTTSAFGDIFLEDLRSYREAQLLKLGISACFPIWKRDTGELIREFLDLGFRAIVVSIRADLLDSSFTGRVIDREFLNDLPSNVDPCGENGEFHTFCYDGPIFKKPVGFTPGDKVYREYKNPEQDGVSGDERSMGFWYCDLLPV